MYNLRFNSAFMAAALAVLMYPAPAAAISNDIQVSVRTLENGPHLAGLPVLLVVEVRNTGSTEVTVPALNLSGRDNPYNSVDIFAGYGEADMERVKNVAPEFGPWKSGLPPEPPPPLALPPDEVREITVVLSYNWRPEHETLLVVPGALRIQAALCDYGPDAVGNPGIDCGNCVHSNVLELAIEKPEGETAEAWEMARTSERPWLLAHPAAVEHLTQDADFRRFQEIANLEGGPYSRHAAAVVAYMYAEGNALDLNPGRPPQPLVAKQWLDRATGGKNVDVWLPDWIALAEKLDAKLEEP